MTHAFRGSSKPRLDCVAVHNLPRLVMHFINKSVKYFINVL
jgi:hypothetical protein